MPKKDAALEALLQQKLLPLYYHESAEVSTRILQTLYDAGIRVVEYTNRGEDALDNFRALRKLADQSMPGLQLGIGTIKNKKAAKNFIEAGADFIVCPSVNEKVAEVTHEAGLLWVPGCMTPTEIATAESADAKLVKIFPGNILGPSYISAVKELFPDLLLMPTGGVEAEENNLRNWFGAGVVAVGLGSKLLAKDLIQAGNYDQLKQNITNALQLIQKVAND